MRLFASALGLLLFSCLSAGAWNPRTVVDPADSNSLRNAGIEIKFYSWRHVNSTITRYCFSVTIDTSQLSVYEPAAIEAVLRRSADVDQWDVKVYPAKGDPKDRHARMVFEITDEFLEHSFIEIQTLRDGEGIGSYRLDLGRVVQVKSLCILLQKTRPPAEGDGKK